MPIYECEMKTTVTLHIKANSMDEAMDWMSTHTYEDVKASTRYAVDYEDEIIGKVTLEEANGTFLDISDGTDDDWDVLDEDNEEDEEDEEDGDDEVEYTDYGEL